MHSYIYRLYLTFLLLTLQNKVYCQMLIPNEYDRCSLLIDINNGETFGSGILYSTEKSLYIITAKHIISPYLKDPLKVHVPLIGQAKITAFFKFTQESDSTEKVEIGMNIKELAGAGMISKHREKDIAVIKIAAINNSGFKFLKGISFYKQPKSSPLSFGEGLIKKFVDVRTTRDVFVFGYPKTIGLENNPQYDFNLPLVQKGIISAKDNTNKSYIINCSVYGGNSGGPVIMINIESDRSNLKLIGLVTERIPYINRENTFEFNSGYAVVTPIEYALELMEDLDKVRLNIYK